MEGGCAFPSVDPGNCLKFYTQIYTFWCFERPLSIFGGRRGGKKIVSPVTFIGGYRPLRPSPRWTPLIHLSLMMLMQLCAL